VRRAPLSHYRLAKAARATQRTLLAGSRYTIERPMLVLGLVNHIREDWMIKRLTA
jgi:hypothetical protein